MIDLRSDTVTRPTKGMMDAMLSAPVGDDVFGEDPTVNALEARMAAMFGFEAGLFCPSGTMTNQIAIKAHTQPLDEIICDQLAHIYNYEVGGWAFHSGVSIKLVDTPDGVMNASQIEACIQPDQDWLPNTSMVCIENTVNRGGGSVYSLETMKEISAMCKRRKLIHHLDGARIFNALTALNIQPIALQGVFDSISICLSKGLGTPVGSVLVGNKDFIKKSRKIRKVMGGGMRQAGILAAAGMYALDHHVQRLSEDHQRASALAEALAKHPLVASVRPCATNIVIFSMHDSDSTTRFIQYLAHKEIKAVPFGGNSVRFVTHLDFTDDMLEQTLDAIQTFQ
jgi:threonine aldolase